MKRVINALAMLYLSLQRGRYFAGHDLVIRQTHRGSRSPDATVPESTPLDGREVFESQTVVPAEHHNGIYVGCRVPIPVGIGYLKLTTRVESIEPHDGGRTIIVTTASRSRYVVSAEDDI